MWSYDAEMSTGRDQVRFLIQDTTSTRQLFQDEEIDWMLTQEANIYMAGAALCDMLLMRNKGVKYKKIGDLSISFDSGLYKLLANQLRARGNNYQIPYAGGISSADKAAHTADTDAPRSAFARGLGDNPEAPRVVGPSNNPLTDL